MRENIDRQTPPALIWIAWVVVGIPLAWGVYETVVKASALFK